MPNLILQNILLFYVLMIYTKIQLKDILNRNRDHIVQYVYITTNTIYLKEKIQFVQHPSGNCHKILTEPRNIVLFLLFYILAFQTKYRHVVHHLQNT